MIAVILVVGGLTRLNQAGLSITEWEVVRGVIPPLSEAQWKEVFETYRQYPEYQEIHRGMSLSEFKVIYWWEYSHRMLSRFLGVLFLLPFLWFVARRAMPPGYVYPTFPKMGDYWIPPQIGYFTPLWYDLTHNAISVQFIHRLLGLLLTIFILIPAVAGLRSGSVPLQLAGFALLLIITLQITTGALNLLWGVPVWLASLHQLCALLLLAALLTWLNMHSRLNTSTRNSIL